MDDTSDRHIERSEAVRKPQTALLIGDDPEVKSALTDILTPEGWTLEQSSNLDDALALAKSRQFDLIVTSRETSGNRGCGVSAADCAEYGRIRGLSF